MIFIIERYIIKKNIISLIKYINYLLFSLQYICALALSMGSEQSHPDSKLQQLHRLETKYSRMNKGTNKAMGIRDKIMFLRGFLGAQGSESNGMLTTAELKVGERYKQLSDRHASGFDTCKTLRRKEHLRDGKKYGLTFHMGKKRVGNFYNITDKPIFKRCGTRRRVASSSG